MKYFRSNINLDIFSIFDGSSSLIFFLFDEVVKKAKWPLDVVSQLSQHSDSRVGKRNYINQSQEKTLKIIMIASESEKDN